MVAPTLETATPKGRKINKEMTKVAIVILNWNGEKLLPQFLPSVIAHSKVEGAELIVADNASEDDSLAVMARQFPEVRTIELSKNYGFAEGYNQALKEVDAEYYLLLNSDVEVTKDWLKPLLATMESDKNIAACGPKILDYKRKTHFEYAGAAGGFIDQYGFPFCRGRIFSELEEDKGQYDNERDVLWVSGCALMVRAENYFFAHMEEIDFCWRLNKRGFRVVNVPQSVVYHLGGASLNAASPHKTYLNFRNSLLMIYKNTNDYALRKVLRRRRRLDAIASYKFLLGEGFKHYDAVNQAHIDFQKMCPSFEQKRQKNLENSNNEDAYVLQQSLVKAFYIHRKTHFTDYAI